MPNKPLEDPPSDEPIDWNLRPFRPAEADQVKELLSKIVVVAKRPDPDAVMCNCWLEVLDAARTAEFREKTVEDEQEERPRERNRFREKLNKIAKTSDPKLTHDMEILIPLALGACCLGLIRRPPALPEEAAHLKALSKLTGVQIRESAKEALKSPFLVGDKGGRPSAKIFDGYIESLMGIYDRASGTPDPHAINTKQTHNSWLLLVVSNRPPPRRGKRSNMLRFLRACLAPFKKNSDYCDAAHSYSGYSDDAIFKSVRRVLCKP
jgi:hypothetical protein